MLATTAQSVHESCVPVVLEQQLEHVPYMPDACGHWIHVLRYMV